MAIRVVKRISKTPILPATIKIPSRVGPAVKDSFRGSSPSTEYLQTLRTHISTQLPELFRQSVWIVPYGSLAYGPKNSYPDAKDIDLLMVSIPSKNVYWGWGDFPEKPIPKGIGFRSTPLDLNLHEIRQFVNLLCKCSPNILPLLWLDSSHWLKGDAALQGNIPLIQNAVRCKDVYFSISGLVNTNAKELEKNPRLSPALRFRKWSHMIRSLTLGIEFFEKDEFFPDRTSSDWQAFLDIRQGLRSEDELGREVEDLKGKLLKAYRRSHLPQSVNRDFLRSWAVELIEQRFQFLRDSPKPRTKK